MLGSGLNLVTTVIGFGMSATFIVFVCTRLLCGCIRSTDSPATPLDLELRSEVYQSEHTISGLEPVLVAAIPTMKYKCEAFSSGEDAQCSICLSEYRENEVLRVMPSCHHNFHLVCIDVWLQKQTTCPICRLPLIESLEANQAASSLHEDQTEGNHEVSGDQYNRWSLPSGQRSERIENYDEIYQSESMAIEVP
ncbi:hypothetical protein C4D60_Mb11t02940 [Musa balbisiana]|uniref:RING-type domain-containing protein n=1 Tax=Musa balbisiana TaxID=52838 RepID=A0A4S8J1F5_MUSBA|nr:hypothetical protein C4D60_Mb11t02940 [Musa balbisiana]